MPVNDCENISELVDIAARAIDQVRKALTSSSEKTDIATSLHGPACSDEEFVSSGDAARYFDVSDDTIRRRAKEFNIETRGSGRCVRYSLSGLRAVI